MSQLHVYTNGTEWWVASDVEYVYPAREEWCGETREDLDDDFWEMDDTETISIVVNELGEIDDNGETLKLSAAEWAVREGSGFLCALEY